MFRECSQHTSHFTAAINALKDFQFAHRVKRDSQAIRQLVELGLEAAEMSAGKRGA